MAFEKEHEIVDELSKLVIDIMALSHPPEIPAQYASVDSLQTLHANLISLREFLYATSSGDLSKRVSFKGYVAGALKTLQANLSHMTWQTKMIASGDFTQRVDFMGEFSESFNTMVQQLDQTLKDLVSKEATLSQTNKELLKEITVRKQTEAALRKSEEELRFLATTDPLTGLFNRRHFNKLAEEEIHRVLRYSRPLSVMIFDIDFFKRVNDTYGHTSGDMVLKMIARITMETLRAHDISARYGGEEFVVFLPETPVAQAAAVAERLRKQIENTPVEAENETITVTASFGVSDYLGETEGKSLEKIESEFIAGADRALYASKDGGRNRVTIFDPEQESL